jgi:outer membrane receptor protein involved in Fe transport
MITSGSTNIFDFWGAMNGDTARIIYDDDYILSILMDRILVAYKGKKDFINASFYCSDGWDITDRLHSDFGFRIEYNQEDHSKLISPRLTFNYNLNEKNELLASAGLYTQNNYDIGVIELSSELRPEKVWHGVLGWESKILPWLTQKVDVYGKFYYDLTSEIIHESIVLTNDVIQEYIEKYTDIYIGNPDTLSDETYQKLLAKAKYDLGRYSSLYENNGRGKSYGFEYMLRYDPTDFWHGWISLSMGKSLRERRKGWRKHPFPLDRPLLISVNNYYRLPRRYEISLKYRYMSGLPYTSVKEKNNLIYIGNFNDSRYRAYQSLDIRFAKGFSIRRVKGSLYTEIWNAMNSPNSFGIDSKSKEIITMFPNLPVTMLFFGVECKF